jgi:hypothetical protein
VRGVRLTEDLAAALELADELAEGYSFTNYRLRILLACGGCNRDLLGTPPR